MSNLANWSYTATATLWQLQQGTVNLAGDRSPGSWARKLIKCDYQGGLSKRINGVGAEIVVKNTFWTEEAAKAGDFIAIGESNEDSPQDAGADEILQVIRYADTFDRQADDYALITGV